MPLVSAMARSASALGLSTLERWSGATFDTLDGGRRDIGGGFLRDLLRIAMAVAAAAPAASNAVPASTFGQRRACGLGGSSLLATPASTDETLGATLSWTEMLPRAAPPAPPRAPPPPPPPARAPARGRRRGRARSCGCLGFGFGYRDLK